MARSAFMLALCTSAVGCCGFRVDTTGHVPPVRRLAVASLPPLYRSQVVEELSYAGIEVVPKQTAQFELVVFLGLSDHVRARGNGPSGHSEIDDDSVGRHATGWDAVLTWLFASLGDDREETAESERAGDRRRLLVQVVDLSSQRVVWTCRVDLRNDCPPPSAGEKNADRDGLQQALRRFVSAMPSESHEPAKPQ